MSDEVGCRNFAQLAAANPVEGDDQLRFYEEGHRYTFNGREVPMSVTKVVEWVFGAFCPAEIVAKNYVLWQQSPRSEYHGLVKGKTLEEAVRACAAHWDRQAQLGTDLHYALEKALNTNECCAEIAPAVALLEGWRPFRTELSVCWRTSAPIVYVAGQLDALLKTPTGSFVIIDLKRTAKPIVDAPGKFDTKLPPPFEGEYNTHFVKFSLQLSMYCVMLKQIGICVDNESRYVLQVNPKTNQTRLIKMRALDAAATKLLDKASGVA